MSSLGQRRGRLTSRSSVTIQPTHGNTKQGPHCQEVVVSRTETRSQFQHNEQDVVDDERPLSPITIGRQTEDDTAHAPQHEHKGDAPCDVSLGFAKRLGEVRDGQGDGEEVKGIPCPGKKGNEEEEPLLEVQHAEESYRVGHLVMCWFEGGNACCNVATSRHMRRLHIFASLSTLVLVVCHDEGRRKEKKRRADVVLLEETGKQAWDRYMAEQTDPIRLQPALIEGPPLAI